MILPMPAGATIRVLERHRVRFPPATHQAKDAADVIQLEKDLDALADSVAEGHRIFANTIK